MSSHFRVECYAGYRGDETPRRIFFDDRGIEVIEILDRWLDPDYRYFKVKGNDGLIYILQHDANSLQWKLASAPVKEKARFFQP